jgi:serine/threonine protein kinase
MEKKKNKISRIQRIKKLNKFSTSETNVYLIKYIPKKSIKNNNGILEPIICIEKEININKISSEINYSKEKLEKEIKLINSFPSNYFLKIFEYFQYPENVFHIITENYQSDLSELIKQQITKKNFFSENIIISIFTQIFNGIKYLHDLNILHRNINPSNIVLISNKTVKISISNFFLRSLFNENERSITFVNNNYLEYMSPEMVMNIPYSFKNDIWALGVLLFHMLSLKLPFNFKQLNEIQFTKKVESNLLYNRLPRYFSNDIKNLCVQLLKAFPADRPDINNIFKKYKIFSNKNDFLINMNKTECNNDKIINNINNNKHLERKHNFKSFCSKYIKFGSDRKIITKNIKDNEHKDSDFKISIYENIKEKIEDPYNIIYNKQNNIMNTNIININSDSNNISDSNSNKVKDSEEEKTE